MTVLISEARTCTVSFIVRHLLSVREVQSSIPVWPHPSIDFVQFGVALSSIQRSQIWTLGEWDNELMLS